MIIGISSRIDFITERSEYRDALDHRVHNIARYLGATSLALPNIDTVLRSLIKHIRFNGFILSGGNNLSLFENSFAANTRDEIERTILNYAILHELPVLGICRGAQFIADFFSSRLIKRNHVGSHTVRAVNPSQHLETEVNSYHQYCVGQLAKQLCPLAIASDGTIEAFHHVRLPLFAVMWHPERSSAFNIIDHQILKMYTACMKH